MIEPILLTKEDYSEGSAETVMSDDKVRSVYLGESFSL